MRSRPRARVRAGGAVGRTLVEREGTARSVVRRGLLAWGVGPVMKFVFFFRLTVIPHTERQTSRSQGDAYRGYQRTSSAFVPWPSRQGAV